MKILKDMTFKVSSQTRNAVQNILKFELQYSEQGFQVVYKLRRPDYLNVYKPTYVCYIYMYSHKDIRMCVCGGGGVAWKVMANQI
jgi:hypothetical protein